MRLRNLIVLAMLAAGLFVSPAQASYMPITVQNGSLYAASLTSYDFGDIALGQELTQYSSGTLAGYIAPDSTIVFDYNIKSSIIGSFYSFIESANQRFAYVQYKTQPNAGGLQGGIAGGGAPLLFADANVIGSDSIVTLSNFTTAPAYFNLDYDNNNNPGQKLNGISSINASYNLSYVPLPGSVGMFAAGLLCLAAFSLYRKNQIRL